MFSIPEKTVPDLIGRITSAPTCHWSSKLGAALMSVSVEQGVAGGSPGSAPTFVAMAHLTFESVPAFQAAFTPHAAEIMADISKYTSIEPIIQISEVKVGA